MTTVDGRHTIDREAERLAYKPPEIRHDKQGDMEDEARVTAAMHHFVKNFNTQTSSYLDGCLHCGMCADACHFHVRTDDPRYTPIWQPLLSADPGARPVIGRRIQLAAAFQLGQPAVGDRAFYTHLPPDLPVRTERAIMAAGSRSCRRAAPGSRARVWSSSRFAGRLPIARAGR